eukprot:418946-Pleurochrysis_carterae.AAC.2
MHARTHKSSHTYTHSSTHRMRFHAGVHAGAKKKNRPSLGHWRNALDLAVHDPDSGAMPCNSISVGGQTHRAKSVFKLRLVA